MKDDTKLNSWNHSKNFQIAVMSSKQKEKECKSFHLFLIKKEIVLRCIQESQN